MNFTQLNLSPKVIKALSVCGYEKPTQIQAKSIPDILKGRDFIGSAQTGSGKTATFILPALDHLVQNKSKSRAKTKVLVLTPTRELANQVTAAARKYGKFIDFNIASIVGGVPYGQQLKMLTPYADIVVATPGRLIDLMKSKRLDLSGVEMLVLDEADRMLDMGFIDDIKMIVNKTPAERQTILFSATMDNSVTNQIKNFLKDPIKIDLSHEKTIPKEINQIVYATDDNRHKAHILEHLFANNQFYKTIIFTNTKRVAEQLARQLEDASLRVGTLHGDLKQTVRTRTIKKLQTGAIEVLIATDVAARGIDIDISHVINWDLPKFYEDYVHRIGRTGRAGKSGTAISFVLPNEFSGLQKIERVCGLKFDFSVVEGLEPKKKMFIEEPKKPRRRPRRNKPRFSAKKKRAD